MFCHFWIHFKHSINHYYAHAEMYVYCMNSFNDYNNISYQYANIINVSCCINVSINLLKTLMSIFFSGRIDGILLGDSGYPTKRYLMTPFGNPIQAYQIKYNAAHTRTRVLIEQTFGILKRRFGLLKDKLRLTPDKACKVTVACVILHNLGINVGDIIPFHDEHVFEEADHVDPVLLNEQGDGLQVRDYIARTHFN